MPTEKRLITFSEREVREAILMLPAAARPAAWDETNEITLGQGTAVRVKLAGDTDFEVTQDKVGAALLLFCKAERIPVPKQGRKSLRRDETGITLVIDAAEALLSNPWETYDAPQHDVPRVSGNPAIKCRQCGEPIVQRGRKTKRTAKATRR